MRYRFGPFELDTDASELRADGAPRAVEPRVFALIALLVENRDRLVSKDELIEKVWDGRIVSDAAVSSCIKSARQALDEFVASRAREGDKLAGFLRDRAAAIGAIIAPLQQRSPELLAAWQARLVERLRAALEQTEAPVPIEETMARVRQEVTAYGLRIDVAEELSRLQAHLDELARILEAGSPAGKRLDFLMQEFNREANTLGSKAAAIDLTGASIELKVLIEQMREQVQNIE